MQCKCGSYAINHGNHGRDGSDGDLCDVCYWRTRAERLNTALLSVAKTMSWRFFGECRAFSEYGDTGEICTPADAEQIARAALLTPNAELTGAAPTGGN